MKNVRKLTEGALFLAAFTVLLLITIYIPLIGSILNLVLPLPFIMFSAKNNLKNIAAFFVAAMILSFIAGSIMGLGLMLLYGSAGVVIGYMVQRERSRTAILISCSLTLMVGLVIYYIVLVAFMKVDIIHELQAILNQSIRESQDMLKGIGSKEQIELLKKQNANMINMVESLAPSLLILVSILNSFMLQLVCFPIAKRFGVNVQPWGNFRNLSLPKSLLWYYLIALGGMMLFHPQEGTYLYLVFINARYILEMFLFFQGLSCLFFIFHQRSIVKGLGVFIVILTFIIPTVHYIMLLGIINLGFDFRKRFVKKE